MAASLKLSEMSGKLEGLQAINVDTLSNSYCQRMSCNPSLICSRCYSVRILSTYRKSCRPPWQVNGELLSKSFVRVPRIKAQYCRFNAHGELINGLHLYNLYRIVKGNPGVKFALWSKRAGLVTRFFKRYAKLDNLILIYSNPFMDKVVKKPAVFDKVFNVKTDSVGINCGGRKCIDCRICYEDNGVSVINEMLK